MGIRLGNTVADAAAAGGGRFRRESGQGARVRQVQYGGADGAGGATRQGRS